jgi:hypothetical protein
MQHVGAWKPMFERLTGKGFQVLALHHAEAILRHDMPEAVTELEQTLSAIEIPVAEPVRGGGGEGAMTQRLHSALGGMSPEQFEARKTA